MHGHNIQDLKLKYKENLSYMQDNQEFVLYHLQQSFIFKILGITTCSRIEAHSEFVCDHTDIDNAVCGKDSL